MNEDAAVNELTDERVTLRRFQSTGPGSGKSHLLLCLSITSL